MRKRQFSYDNETGGNSQTEEGSIMQIRTQNGKYREIYEYQIKKVIKSIKYFLHLRKNDVLHSKAAWKRLFLWCVEMFFY